MIEHVWRWEKSKGKRWRILPQHAALIRLQIVSMQFGLGRATYSWREANAMSFHSFLPPKAEDVGQFKLLAYWNQRDGKCSSLGFPRNSGPLPRMQSGEL